MSQQEVLKQLNTTPWNFTQYTANSSLDTFCNFMSSNWTYVQLRVWTFTPTDVHQLFTYRVWACPRLSSDAEKLMTLTGIKRQPSSPKMISFSWFQTLWYPSGVPWRQSYCGCHQQHGWEDYCHPLARGISERVPIHGRSAHGNPVFYTWEWHIPIRLYR